MIIEFKIVGNNLQCEINDNGVGYYASQFNNTRTHESTGIQNILDRIKLIEMKYNLKMGFQIIDKSELDPQTTGTIVRLSVPLEVTYSEF